MSRLDELLAPLVDAAEAATFPLRGDGEGWRPRVQAALSEALRGTVTDEGGQHIDGDRLTAEGCRASARSLLIGDLPNNPAQRESIIQTVASLLLQVREADQRERWIRDGYAFDSRLAWERAEAAEQRAAELEQAVRVMKRATPGREGRSSMTGPSAEENAAACDRCHAGKPRHTLSVNGERSRECCRCHVTSGNPPADWHPECMATFNGLPPRGGGHR